jgi:hypothetical protein
VLFGVALWMLLNWGSSHLKAPVDLTGNWQPQGELAQAAHSFNIRQSGRFIELAFENGPQIDLTLTVSSPIDPKTIDGGERLTLEGDGWQVLTTGRMGNDWRQFDFHPPAEHGTGWSGVYRSAGAHVGS